MNTTKTAHVSIISLLATVTCLTLSPLHARGDECPPEQTERVKELKARPVETLKKIYDREWNYGMLESPEWATYAGDPRNQDRLNDLSPESIERRRIHDRCLLAELDSLDPAKIASSDDRLNYDLFRRGVAESVAFQRFPTELLLVSQMGGEHSSLTDLLLTMRRQTVKDFENAIARMKAAPTKIRQEIALLKKGLALKVTPARVTLTKLPEQVTPLLDPDPKKNPLYEIFRATPSSITPDDAKRIQEEALRVLRTEVIPAFKEYHEFLKNDYVPKAQESIAWTKLPDGEAWYQALVRSHTTTDRSPQEIHETGLKEVERIRGLMFDVMKKSGFKKDLAAFFHFLRNDKRFFFHRPEELLAGYRDIAKRIDPELAHLFGKLPRLTYGVKAIPDFTAPRAPTAYYMGGSIESGRPGWFIANTYDLKSRPKWEMEPLTAHEAVPGHHLQIALQQELENRPKFRQNNGFTAFTEGWGLYAESLGPEVGLYRNSYSKFGQLTYEMWRACRLVVDTGIHSFGWTRERSIAFMRDNMPKPLHDIEVEVDRYIVTPGQALAYKTGELKFKELRARAEHALGEKFDIRAFHDAVLAEGALPLDILDKRMNDWIEARLK